MSSFRKSHPPHIPTGPAGFEVFTFYPSLEEFKDFKGYVQKIEAVGAHRRSGICKVRQKYASFRLVAAFDEEWNRMLGLVFYRISCIHQQ